MRVGAALDFMSALTASEGLTLVPTNDSRTVAAG
jgi:hypothetical protein